MTDTPQPKSLADTLRCFPYASAAGIIPGALATATTLTGTHPVEAAMSLGATGIVISSAASLALAGGSAINIIDGKRSKLSRVFSGAALLTAASPLVFLGGSDFTPLLTILVTPFTGMIAGAFNLAARATKDKHISASVTITDNTPKGPPPAP